MNETEIKDVLQKGIFPYDQEKPSMLIETPISYVILKGEYAYKIKRNVRLSYLDFSTLKNRKHFCLEELRLNKRLSGDMYINVLPLTKKGTQWFIGDFKGKAIEYAVQMKRMKPEKQLSALLLKHSVTKNAVKKLAEQIADFHIHEKSIKFTYDPFFLSNEFADIRSVQSIVKKQLGTTYHALIKNSIKLSDFFIILQKDFIVERMKKGYFKECHGDLHSKNIFMYKEPLVFDCVEFKKEFRQIDVLNEIAFLCMDLETSGHQELSNTFLNTYIKHTDFEFSKSDECLFTYFKALRACIRAKVEAMHMSEHPENKSIQEEVKKYIIAMTRYAEKAITSLY